MQDLWRACKGMYKRTDGLDSSPEFGHQLSAVVYIDTGVAPSHTLRYVDTDYLALAMHVRYGHGDLVAMQRM